MTFHIITGNCLDVLRELEAESVHCVTTSPPYWGLRCYGIPPTMWRDGWTGDLGLEPNPDMFIEHLVEVFEEVLRVLRKDGTLWLNLGDTYATGAGKVGEHPGGGAQGARWKGENPNRIRDDKRGYRGDRLENNGRGDEILRKKTRADRDGSNAGKHTAMAALGPMTQPNRMPQAGLKPKDLVGIPWMAAFALRKAGWWLRSDVIWHKPNPMPESTEDRPTKSHEYLFLLTKSEHYFYDAHAIREPDAGTDHPRNVLHKPEPSGGLMAPHQGIRVEQGRNGTGRNKRSVWTVATQPFAEAHFATFPPALIEPCILAGTSERGCCPTCMTGWDRITAPTARYAAILGSSYHDQDDDQE